MFEQKNARSCDRRWNCPVPSDSEGEKWRSSKFGQSSPASRKLRLWRCPKGEHARQGVMPRQHVEFDGLCRFCVKHIISRRVRLANRQTALLANFQTRRFGLTSHKSPRSSANRYKTNKFF